MQASSDKGLGASLRDGAAALGEYGRRAWNEADPGLRDGGRRFGYLVAAIVNAVLLALVNGPLVWRIPFLTEDFLKVLPIVELSLTASVVANLMLVVYDASWLRHFVRAGLSAIAFVTTYALLTVFPFDFPTAVVANAVSFGLTIALVCIAIATVVELCQFLFGWTRR